MRKLGPCRSRELEEKVEKEVDKEVEAQPIQYSESRVYDFGNCSSFQNLSEYIRCIIDLVGMVEMGIRMINVEMRGDYVSALTRLGPIRRDIGGIERVTNTTMVSPALCVNYELDAQVYISGHLHVELIIDA